MKLEDYGINIGYWGRSIDATELQKNIDAAKKGHRDPYPRNNVYLGMVWKHAEILGELRKEKNTITLKEIPERKVIKEWPINTTAQKIIEDLNES